MELNQSQKVEYYLIVDAQFKKIEVYQLQNYKYKAAAINMRSYEFIFGDCKIEVSFSGI